MNNKLIIILLCLLMDQIAWSQQAPPKSLTDTLHSSGYEVFAELLEITGVAAEMEKLKEYTCYAPRNEAFELKTIEKIRSNPQDESVKQLLKYHFIGAMVPQNTMMLSRRLKTMSGRYLVFWVSGGQIRFNEKSDLLEADLKTERGLVHKISKVLDDQAPYTQP